MKKIISIIFFIFLSIVNIKIVLATNDNSINEIMNQNYDFDEFNDYLKNNTEFDNNKITFLTPGMGNDSSTWGTNSSIDDATNKQTVFSQSSIISYLMRKGADVYVVLTNSENNIFKYQKINDLKSINILRGSDSGMLSFDDEILSSDGTQILPKLNVNKPNVFIIHPYKTNKGHNLYNEIENDTTDAEAYYECEAIINRVIYEYIDSKIKTEGAEYIPTCPMINLIGHSRGGLLNMLYSIEHPSVVDTLVSIGTPYNGSILGESPGMIELLNYIGTINKDAPACKDILDKNCQDSIREKWNELHRRGQCNTKLVAIGSSMTLSYIEELFNELIDSTFSNQGFLYGLVGNIMLNSFNDFLGASYYNIEEQEEYIDRYVINYDSYRVNKFIDHTGVDLSLLICAVNIINYFQKLFNLSEIPYVNCLVCDNVYCVCDSGRKDAINVFNDFFKQIAERSYYDPTVDGKHGKGDFVFEDDIFVDLNSQHACGFENVIKYEKVFTINTDKHKDSSNTPAIGHSIERFDEDIIKCVLSNIDLGYGDNGLIINENFEIIGYNYDKLVKVNDNERILRFDNCENYMSSVENGEQLNGGTEKIHYDYCIFKDSKIPYKLSPKFFGIEYNDAQVSDYSSILNGNIITHETTDNIDKMIFDINLILQSDSLIYLKDQVVFEFTQEIINGAESKKYFLENNSIYSANIISNEIDLSTKTLVKFGNNGNVVNYVILDDLSHIEDGAFFCQPIKEVIVDTSLKSIGDYAFYGCRLLRKIEYGDGTYSELEKVGECAFQHTEMQYASRKLVVLGFLIQYLDYIEVFKLSDFDNIVGIAPGAVTNHKELKTIVLDDIFIKIMPKAFCDIEVEGIFLYFVDPVTGTPFMDIDEDAFLRVGVKTIDDDNRLYYTYDLYSNYQIMFNGQTASTSIKLNMKYTDETNVEFDTIINLTNENSNYSINLDNYNKGGKDCIGLCSENVKKTPDELYQNVDIWDLYNKTIYVYLDCNSHNLLNVVQNDNFSHYICCSKCDYSVLENHNLGEHIILNEYGHQGICETCQYIKNESHTFELNIIIESNENNYYNSEFLHKTKCDFCDYDIIEEHNYDHHFEGEITAVCHIKTCNVCNHEKRCSSNVEVLVDNDDNHTLICLTCEDICEISNHQFCTFDYENDSIDICIYCEYHICDGIIGEANNNTHELYCRYCLCIKTCEHVFSDNSEIMNVDNNIETGYHNIECDICNYVVSQSHTYEMLDDMHTLECTVCSSTYILCHNEVTDLLVNQNGHAEYCDFCEYYYLDYHTFIYYEEAGYNENGHYMICSDCGFIKIVNHVNQYHNIGNDGHIEVCRICNYQGNVIDHNLLYNCLSSNTNEHYAYCNNCAYETSTELIYESLHEYEHSAICTVCNKRFTECHAHNCDIIDEELHLYKCYYCEVEYEMPHYVNEQYIIYYYDDTYYRIICLYCGYEGLLEHKDINCPCEQC